MPSLHLTKSRFIAGQQCLRRLWLMVHEPIPYEEPPPGSPLDIGQEIGRAAHRLFPGGTLVDEEPWQHDRAVARTASLMADPAVPAIFEAAFAHDDVRVRVDVLERLDAGIWGLREVKSSARVKDYHLDDIALQVHVLRGAWIGLSSIEILHVNTGYVRGDGGIDWPLFFARRDVAEELPEQLASVPAAIPVIRAWLDCGEMPEATPGDQCSSPYECEFWDRCTAHKPADWIIHLPRISARQRNALEKRGIERIIDIPDDFGLTGKQAIIRNATASGRGYVAPDLARLLRGYGPPACYLDFEAMMPAIPLYPGTRPYQTIPFEWSLHVLDADGCLSHSGFLAAGNDDPRREFAETLLAALATDETPVIVYSAYEQTRLRDLAVQFPDLAIRLHAIVDRLVDLLPVVRNAVYFPQFGFSNSIKAVAPALSPGFGYDDLDVVADGAAASAVFGQMASGHVNSSDEITRLRAALLAYCERDTLAMVRVHQALMRLATEAAPGSSK